MMLLIWPTGGFFFTKEEILLPGKQLFSVVFWAFCCSWAGEFILLGIVLLYSQTLLPDISLSMHQGAIWNWKSFTYFLFFFLFKFFNNPCHFCVWYQCFSSFFSTLFSYFFVLEFATSLDELTFMGSFVLLVTHLTSLWKIYFVCSCIVVWSWCFSWPIFPETVFLTALTCCKNICIF